MDTGNFLKFDGERKNVPAAGAWLLNTFVWIGGTIYAITTHESNVPSQSQSESDQGESDQGGSDTLNALILALTLGMLVGIAFVGLSMYVAKIAPTRFVYVTFGMWIVMPTVLAFYLGSLGILLYPAGVIIYFLIVRSRLPLASKMLGMSLKTITKVPAMVLVSTIFSILMIFPTVFYFVGIVYTFEEKNELSWLLIFTGGWTIITIKHAVGMAFNGAAAAYLLQGDKMESPTWSALKHSFNKGFGVAAIGAAFISITTILLTALLFAIDNWMLKCIFHSVIVQIKDTLRLLSHYAYSYSIIHDQEFMDAAKSTKELFKARGFDAFVTGDLSQKITRWVIFCSAIVMGGTSFAIFEDNLGISDSFLIILYILLFTILSYVIMSFIGGALLSPITNTTVTLFVVMAENFPAFQNAHPERALGIQKAAIEQFGNELLLGDVQAQVEVQAKAEV